MSSINRSSISSIRYGSRSSRGSDNQVIFSLIGELEKYTLAHFAAEETLMRITDYPQFDKHKKEHQDFVARVVEEKAQAVATGQLSLDMMYFLE